MTEKKAFPRPAVPLSGMTLLDYFAGQALAGYLGRQIHEDTIAVSRVEIAESCYELAAEMLFESGERHDE